MLTTNLSGQVAQNFVVTDYNNVEHDLYDDYLNQGKTVAIKIFFTYCPPCQAQAPLYEDKYQSWGAGQYDVEFFELSNKTNDSNSAVSNFAATYGTTMPAAGNQGGSVDAISQFTSGTFGTYYGAPTYIVIAPSGEVIWDVGLSGLDDAISQTGANGMGSSPPPSNYTLNITDRHNVSLAYGNSQVFMKSNSDANYSLNITPFISNGTFTYPSDDIPEVLNPTLSVLNTEQQISGVSAIDLLQIQKHLLNIQPFESPYQLLAADANSSSSITALDLLEIRKVLLNILPTYPLKPVYNFYFPDCANCQEYSLPFTEGTEYTIRVVRVTTGDIH